MKIAYVTDVVYPYVVGGAEKRLWELSKKLAEDGENEVHVYSVKWWTGADLIVSDNVYLHGVCRAHELYNEQGVRSIKEGLIFSLKLLPYLLTADFDVLDCSQFPYFPCFTSKIASIIKRRPLVITWLEVWDKYWYDYLGLIGGSAGRIIEMLTMHLPDRIIAISNMTRNELIRHKVDPERVDVIPIGIDTERISKVHAAPERVDVLFAGRLIPEKNIDILLYALSIVKKAIPTISCLVVGDGPERHALEDLAHKLELDGNVIFTGFVDEDRLIAYMKGSKMLILPSVREGFGLVIIEANACKLPVIGIRHHMSAVEELVHDGKNGFLISNISPNEIAKVVFKLVKDGALRKQLAETGFKMSQKYAWSEVSNSILATYRQLIS